MSHSDYPVKAVITFKNVAEPTRTFYCDVATFLDPMGDWFGIVVGDEPIFTVPKDEIKYIETIYLDKEENNSQEENFTH